MVVMRIGGLAIATVVAVSIVFAGCGGSGGVKSAQESSPSASSTTTGVAPSPTWVPTSPLPSVTGLDALITFLADHGVVCDHVDVENEDATALPTGPEIIAMCYRPHGENTLELLIYRSAHDRTSNRPGTTLLPCSRSPEASALNGRIMAIAEGENFDIRAAESRVSTPTSLTALNTATENIARQTRLRPRSITFGCSR